MQFGFQSMGRLPDSLPMENCRNIKIFAGDGCVMLKWNNPALHLIGGFPVDTWGKTVIVRKKGSAPQSPEDGDVVEEVTKTLEVYSLTDEGLTNGKRYYYRFFSFSKAGELLQDEVVKQAIPRKYNEYEVILNKGASNIPCRYAGANKNWAAKDSRWLETLFRGIEPVLMENGQVVESVDKANFRELASGAYISPEVQRGRDIMIKIPRMGVRISTQGNEITVNVTDNPASPTHSYYAFSRGTGEEEEWADNLYIGAFLGARENEPGGARFGSMFDRNLAPLLIRTMEEGLQNRKGYSLLTFHSYVLLQALYLLYARTVDSQQAIGAGLTVSSSPILGRTGGTADKGLIYGTVAGHNQVKFLGIEDLWGHRNCYVKNLETDLNSWRYNATLPRGISSFSLGTNNTLVGYIREVVGNNEFGFLPKRGGLESAYYPWPDNQAIFKGKPLTVGGDTSTQNRAGIFYVRAEHGKDREFYSRIQFLD